MKRFIILLSAILLATACSKEDLVTGEFTSPTLPAQKHSYAQEFDVLQSKLFAFQPDSNQVTDAGATLGRVLFYDTKLSLNNRTSCGTCHQQSKGFADGLKLSEGFRAGETRRNTPTCINTALSSTYFWDCRAEGLENMVLRPVKDHVEMGMESMDQLSVKLARLDYYQPLFADAFGSDAINPELISMALAQFLRSMGTYQSTFDQGTEEHTNMTVLEKEGFELFFNSEKTHCGSCHGGSNFNGWGGSVANIGLDLNYTDNGMGELNNQSGANGFFKVPSLRNVALTAPYMHDGRFATLEQVIEHYDHNVQPHANLDWRMTTNGGLIFFEGDVSNPNVPISIGDPINGPSTTGAEPRKLNLTDHEKSALIAFLHTLTDKALFTDPKFSDPFR